MSEHTALPWTVHRFNPDEIRILSDSSHVAIVLWTESRTPGGTIEFEQREANAEYIVRACNAFPDLLAACKELLVLASAYSPERKAENGVIARANAAIAAQEGGAA
jgi:hypothetical protein